ncbi:DUF4382 domain-containing protein [Candidatus Woesearchaeota archaeon]|nr:DUF4382 domain-containing protein [Candidatus Woesearchaeota archaeon]
MGKLVLGLFLLVLLFGCTQQTINQEKVSSGRVVFVVTDAAADMKIATNVKLTFDSVEVHSNTEGWTNVSSTPKTYDLLQLTEGHKVILADVQLKEGTYQQVRLDVSKVVVTDASGDHEAKLPSGELKIVGELVVKSNTTTAVTFDFIMNESLHVTGNGKYILAPVVRLEIHEDADIKPQPYGKFEVIGKLKTNVKVGMDINGNFGTGLSIPKGSELSIENDKVKVGARITGAAVSEKPKVVVRDLSSDSGDDGGIVDIEGYSIVNQ